MKSKDKLLKLLQELQIEYYCLKDFLEERNSTQPALMFRHQIQGLIANALELTERHSVSLWINRLLAMNVIRLNPTSSKVKGKYMPNTNTKYILNIEAIEAEIAKNRPTTPTPLTSYLSNENSNVVVPDDQ